MSGSAAVADDRATLLEADPGLGPILGVRATAAIGHLPVLPVLRVDPGHWDPPIRADLGDGVLSLTVLSGLLTNGVTVLGPGDDLDPWTGGHWTACTRLRVAVIGDAYVAALSDWPAAIARRSAAAGARVPTSGALADRLLELLWRIALRWGEPAAGGVALPRALDLPALRRILATSDSDVSLALAALSNRGAAVRHGASWLLLVERDRQERREALLGGAALQLALARAIRDDCLALCELAELELGRNAARRLRLA
jgi:hypothetical protein